MKNRNNYNDEFRKKRRRDKCVQITIALRNECRMASQNSKFSLLNKAVQVKFHSQWNHT